LHLEQALALKHDRQDIAGGQMARVIQLNELSQQGLGRVLLNRLRFRLWNFIDSVPVGNKALALAAAFAVSGLPATAANVEAPELLFLIKQKRVVRFLIGKTPAAGFTPVGAGLDVPFVHAKASRHDRNLGIIAERKPTSIPFPTWPRLVRVPAAVRRQDGWFRQDQAKARNLQRMEGLEGAKWPRYW